MTRPPPPQPWRLCVAPMLDWTDRHCRHLHRLLSRHVRLYTEMVTTAALRHGDVARHLDHGGAEHPLALQVGGSEPAELAHAARLAERWGYAEVNLNCGCPSPRVQRGAFGACLMAEPQRVAAGVRAMREAGALEVTVKHRIGLDADERYSFVRDFVGTVAEAGCRVFIVHARNAWLQGLSPKENRVVPPLRHAVVHRLKRDFPALTLVVNGGLVDDGQIAAQLAQVDGAMVGRAAYQQPWRLAGWDTRFFGAAQPPLAERDDAERAMVEYMAQQAVQGVPWPRVARHMLGLMDGRPGARRWRQVWSDHRLRAEPPHAVWRLAQRALQAAAAGAGATEARVAA